MKTHVICAALTCAFLGSWSSPLSAGQESSGDSSARTYEFAYKYRPFEVVRWNVVHRADVRTKVSGSQQTAETVTESIKRWHITEVGADGAITLEHSVEMVDMKQKLTGREMVHYNSQTDKEPPPGFEQTANSIGKVLSVVTMDRHGFVIDRVDFDEMRASKDGLLTLPLPEEPIPVGHVWYYPHTIDVPLEAGIVKKIKARQRFRLVNVEENVATIHVETQILTPVDDPKIEAQLVQREQEGEVKFDLETGRIVEQQMDLDKRVVDFSGPGSSMHYTTRFTEAILPPAEKTARKIEPREPPAANRRPAPRRNSLRRESNPLRQRRSAPGTRR